MTNKTCTTCGEEKDEALFRQHRRECKACANKRVAEYKARQKATDPEAYLAAERVYSQRWREKVLSDPERAEAIRQSARQRSRAIRDADPEAYATRIREKNLKRYGITPEDYDRLLEEQQGQCAICGTPAGNRRLAVDHHHGTGKVRALLCSDCNTALGLFQESPFRLRQALTYLEHHNG